MNFYSASHNLLREAWGSGFHTPFIQTADDIEAARQASPQSEYVSPVPPEEVFRKWHGRRVTWDIGQSEYVVEVPVNRVQTTEGNSWYFGHAAAVKEAMLRGDIFRPPHGRLHLIDEDEVEDTQEDFENGELEYQMGMSEPFTKRDIGTFYVTLLNGNHRFAAAVMAGEPTIPFSVSPNYQEDATEFLIGRRRR